MPGSSAFYSTYHHANQSAFIKKKQQLAEQQKKRRMMSQAQLRKQQQQHHQHHEEHDETECISIVKDVWDFARHFLPVGGVTNSELHDVSRRVWPGHKNASAVERAFIYAQKDKKGGAIPDFMELTNVLQFIVYANNLLGLFPHVNEIGHGYVSKEEFFLLAPYFDLLEDKKREENINTNKNKNGGDDDDGDDGSSISESQHQKAEAAFAKMLSYLASAKANLSGAKNLPGITSSSSSSSSAVTPTPGAAHDGGENNVDDDNHRDDNNSNNDHNTSSSTTPTPSCDRVSFDCLCYYLTREYPRFDEPSPELRQSLLENKKHTVLTEHERNLNEQRRRMAGEATDRSLEMQRRAAIEEFFKQLPDCDPDHLMMPSARMTRELNNRKRAVLLQQQTSTTLSTTSSAPSPLTSPLAASLVMADIANNNNSFTDGDVLTDLFDLATYFKTGLTIRSPRDFIQLVCERLWHGVDNTSAMTRAFHFEKDKSAKAITSVLQLTRALQFVVYANNLQPLFKRVNDYGVGSITFDQFSQCLPLVGMTGKHDAAFLQMLKFLSKKQHEEEGEQQQLQQLQQQHQHHPPQMLEDGQIKVDVLAGMSEAEQQAQYKKKHFVPYDYFVKWLAHEHTYYDAFVRDEERDRRRALLKTKAAIAKKDEAFAAARRKKISVPAAHDDDDDDEVQNNNDVQNSDATTATTLASSKEELARREVVTQRVNKHIASVMAPLCTPQNLPVVRGYQQKMSDSTAIDFFSDLFQVATSFLVDVVDSTPPASNAADAGVVVGSKKKKVGISLDEFTDTCRRVFPRHKNESAVRRAFLYTSEFIDDSKTATTTGNNSHHDDMMTTPTAESRSNSNSRSTSPAATNYNNNNNNLYSSFTASTVNNVLLHNINNNNNNDSDDSPSPQNNNNNQRVVLSPPAIPVLGPAAAVEMQKKSLPDALHLRAALLFFVHANNLQVTFARRVSAIGQGSVNKALYITALKTAATKEKEAAKASSQSETTTTSAPNDDDDNADSFDNMRQYLEQRFSTKQLVTDEGDGEHVPFDMMCAWLSVRHFPEMLQHQTATRGNNNVTPTTFKTPTPPPFSNSSSRPTPRQHHFNNNNNTKASTASKEDDEEQNQQQQHQSLPPSIASSQRPSLNPDAVGAPTAEIADALRKISSGNDGADQHRNSLPRLLKSPDSVLTTNNSQSNSSAGVSITTTPPAVAAQQEQQEQQKQQQSQEEKNQERKEESDGHQTQQQRQRQRYPPAQPYAVTGDSGMVLSTDIVTALRDILATGQALVEEAQIGSPSDDDIAEQERLREILADKKMFASSQLIATAIRQQHQEDEEQESQYTTNEHSQVFFSLALADEYQLFQDVFETLIVDGDQNRGNAQLVEKLLQLEQVSSGLAWADFIALKSLDCTAAYDGSLAYLDLFFNSKKNKASSSSPSFVEDLVHKIDPVELMQNAMFSQSRRMPAFFCVFKAFASTTTASVTKNDDNCANTTATAKTTTVLASIAPQIADELQDFFSDICSHAKAIPNEDRSCRMELIEALMRSDVVSPFSSSRNAAAKILSVLSEGADAQTVISRAAKEGDVALLKMIRDISSSSSDEMNKDVVDFNHVSSGDNTTALIQAVVANCFESVEFLLSLPGIDVTHKSAEGDALFLATALKRDARIIEALENKKNKK